MPQRTIVGPIVDAGGAGLPSGVLRVTPVIPSGSSDDGFVVGISEYEIAEGDVEAPVMAPGRYKIEVIADQERLISFIASISDVVLTDLSAKELWESRVDGDEFSEDIIREGDDLLALSSGAGMAAAALQQIEGELRWTVLPDGDMSRMIYDRERTGADPYDRANHIGTQPIDSIEGIADAARDALPGLIEYAIISERQPAGTNGGVFTAGGNRLRALNTIEVNNSGLAPEMLLDLESSAVTLLPGRRYFGWVEAPASKANEHYLALRSDDLSIDLVGPSYYAHYASAHNNWARLDFSFTIPAGAGAKLVQVFHRGMPFEEEETGFGTATKQLFDNDSEEYTKITILSQRSPTT
jgi:hypothetical protein